MFKVVIQDHGFVTKEGNECGEVKFEREPNFITITTAKDSVRVKTSEIVQVLEALKVISSPAQML